MKRDFDSWNKEKKNLENTGHEELIFHEKEIWWTSIGINLGDEQDGKNDLFERPVLVLRKFNKKLAWVLPMSTQEKIGDYYFPLEHEGKVFTVLLSQLKLMSVKRFRRFIRKISPNQLSLIKASIVKILNI